MKYIGDELELFENAINWKRYYKSKIQSYIKGDVLEVGAGLGGTTSVLCDGKQDSWLCLEPDGELVSVIKKKVYTGILPSYCSVKTGFVQDLSTLNKFDTIIYIDVIEHIEDDIEEIANVTNYLKRGGSLIILVPAFQFLFSEFDNSVGHYRRYTKKRLSEAIPASLKKIDLFYLDSLGFAASLVNKFFLQQNTPTITQVKFWDNYLVQGSKIFDIFFFKKFGKSLIGIWSNK